MKSENDRVRKVLKGVYDKGVADCIGGHGSEICLAEATTRILKEIKRAERRAYGNGFADAVIRASIHAGKVDAIRNRRKV